MSSLKRFLRTWFQRVVRSVAFLPLPMLIGGILLGIGMFYLEAYTGLSLWLREEVPSLTIGSVDTARSTLGLLTGAIITLTVFTFTQIMGLFSQVAGSYSPRLLPLLTGDRALQFVLGAYLGAIVFNVIVLLGIDTTSGGKLPALSILVCAVVDVACLVLFVYFIATISRKIQVSKIIDFVYARSVDAFDRAEEAEHFAVSAALPEFSTWFSVPSPRDGYLGTVDFHRLSELASEYNTRFYLGLPKGHYVPKYQPLLESERELSKEEVHEVLAAVSPIRERYEDWHLPPVRLLAEIAVRAMSPGINDPGTAIDALDKLTSSLARLMHLPQYNVYRAPEQGTVYLRTHSFAEVIRALMQELRNCCAADTLVSRKLLQMLYHLKMIAAKNGPYPDILDREIQALIADNRRLIENDYDRESLAEDVARLRQRKHLVVEELDYLLDAKQEVAGYR